MREIEFRYVFKCGGRVRIHEYTIEDIEHIVGDDADYYKKHGFELISRDQYTGLKDCNGVNICEGDILNICYEKDEFIFDANYSVSISEAGVKFQFLNLAWSHYGYNQYPILTTLGVSDCGLVRRDYRGRWDDRGLCISEWDGYKYSNIFKVIGNIHENPELLSENK